MADLKRIKKSKRDDASVFYDKPKNLGLGQFTINIADTNTLDLTYREGVLFGDVIGGSGGVTGDYLPKTFNTMQILSYNASSSINNGTWIFGESGVFTTMAGVGNENISFLPKERSIWFGNGPSTNKLISPNASFNVTWNLPEVSGTIALTNQFKTINGESILGSGDISVSGGVTGDYLPLNLTETKSVTGSHMGNTNMWTFNPNGNLNIASTAITRWLTISASKASYDFMKVDAFSPSGRGYNIGSLKIDYLNDDRNWLLPDASGTLALQSEFDNFIPRVADAPVQLTINSISSQFTFGGFGGFVCSEVNGDNIIYGPMGSFVGAPRHLLSRTYANVGNNIQLNGPIDLTGNRMIFLPDASGTLALTNQFKTINGESIIGSGNISISGSGELIKGTEGATGYWLASDDRAKKRDIGFNAFDFVYVTDSDTDYGVSGAFSVAFGPNQKLSGDFAIAQGSNNKVGSGNCYVLNGNTIDVSAGNLSHTFISGNGYSVAGSLTYSFVNLSGTSSALSISSSLVIGQDITQTAGPFDSSVVVGFNLTNRTIVSKSLFIGESNQTQTDSGFSHSAMVGQSNVVGGNHIAVFGRDHGIYSDTSLISGSSHVVGSSGNAVIHSIIAGHMNNVSSGSSMVVLGRENTINQNEKVAIGWGLISNDNNRRFTLGKFNQMDSNSIFEFGWGDDNATRFNALKIYNSANNYIVEANRLKSNQQMYLGVLTSDPSDSTEGAIYYNTTTKKFRGRINTGWIDLH